jgi:hypothetical protein
MTDTKKPGVQQEVEPRRDTAWTLQQVEEALRGLRYGSVIITVQDGVVVQVERTERRRFQK